MKHSHFLFLAVACFSLFSACHQSSESRPGNQSFDFKSLSYKASREYLEPVRPGGIDGSPYWNVFAQKFIYAPCFDFQEVSGVNSYRFTLSQGEKSYTFEASKPSAPLSPVWGDLPVGDTDLVVEALDGDGNVVSEVGRRTFFRDFPFQGPYQPAARSYREAAIKALLFIHNIPQIHYWLDHTQPDMSFENNTYACKIIGATVSIECLLARECPSLKEEALQMARNAAECLISNSFPEGTPLAYFPPTYYLEPEDKDGYPHYVREINEGKTMFLEAVKPAHAFLDLYDATGEERYLTQVTRIMDTYQRMQNPDGSFPIKVYISDGRMVENSAFSLPTTLLDLIRRLARDYDIHQYDSIVPKAEKWVNENILRTFDITGQFEDQDVSDLPPYNNITHSYANLHATYLLTKPDATPEDIRNATDLIRMSEDQFVHWNCLPDEEGLAWEHTPCVHEQYHYEIPVDDSASIMAQAFYALYLKTGDSLNLAKALTLMDSITNAQNVTNGQIPTTWEFNGGQWDIDRTFWPNCSHNVIQVLLQLSADGYRL